MAASKFFAVPAEKETIAKLSACVPTNPFVTAGYFESRRRCGYVNWVLCLGDDVSKVELGCGAFIKKGKLDRILEIPSLPSVAASSPFWMGLRQFCQQQGVTKLELGTFGSSPGIEIPGFSNYGRTRSRCEFVLVLSSDLLSRYSSNHKRNIRKGQQSGLVVKRSSSVDAMAAHHELMAQSMDRRRGRGESVSSVEVSSERVEFLSSGAAELFQVLRGDTVLSSVLVLRAPKSGYYHSAGTSPEGMSLGASHFLIHSIASELKVEGAELFNLGGADETSSLARFKSGFGALRVSLPEASYYIGPSWRRRVGNLLSLIRDDRPALLRLLIGQMSRLIVYAADTETVRPSAPQQGLEFRALTSDDLRTLSVDDPSFHGRQRERLSRFGASYAYGIFLDGQIAHVSWLLPPVAMERDIPVVFKARADEAEITCCETLPAFRGRGIYGVAIRNLFEVARGQGVRRIFMKTTPDNKASQSGIEKVGLSRMGSAILIRFPLTGRLAVLHGDWSHVGN